MSNLYCPINIILADDHELFRDGFSVMVNKISEINLVGEARNGKELIQLARKLKPDVIVTDIKMPELDGIQATKELTKEMPEIGIIALSMFEEDSLIIDMLEAGAKGYLLKNAQKDEIMDAIKTINKGGVYYCRNINMKMGKMIAKSNHNPFLSKQEFSPQQIEVIKLICKELSNKEIAERLNIKKRTVDWHRQNILEKINAKNTIGVVIYALKNRIVEF